MTAGCLRLPSWERFALFPALVNDVFEDGGWGGITDEAGGWHREIPTRCLDFFRLRRVDRHRCQNQDGRRNRWWNCLTHRLGYEGSCIFVIFRYLASPDDGLSVRSHEPIPGRKIKNGLTILTRLTQKNFSLYLHLRYLYLPRPPSINREDQAFGVHRGVGSNDFYQRPFSARQVRSSVVLDFGPTGHRRRPSRRRNSSLVPLPFGENRGSSPRRSGGPTRTQSSNGVYTVLSA